MSKLYWIISTIVFSLFISCSSDKTNIEINFKTSEMQDSVKYWEIYLEHRSSNSGFTIVDGMEYNDNLQSFYLGRIYNNGASLIKYPTNVEKEYVIVGIIANNGLRSLLAASNIIKINSSDTVVWVK